VAKAVLPKRVEGGAVEPAPRSEHLGYRMIALEVEDMQKATDLRTRVSRPYGAG